LDVNQPRPFADAVVAYAQAGWPCILPVPINKHPPPVGYTGAEGADTDPRTLATWYESHAESSIALRMPEGVIGIDVDAYIKGKVTKHGDATLAEAVARWGELPPTWSSTARGEGPSRISFYRVPVGRYVTALRPDVEIIQRHHRYAVVWPSPHPDVHVLSLRGSDAGLIDVGSVPAIYRWYDPSGAPSAAPPKPLELPELPEAWVAGLREGATDQAAASAGVEVGQALLAQLLADERPPCAEIESARLNAHALLQKADIGSRHDVMTERTHHLIQLAAAGHTGVGPAIDNMSGTWAAITSGEDRGAEFERMLLTSARKAVTAVGPRQVPSDPCALIGAFEIPAPAAPGPGAPEPIEPPRLWSVYTYIGTQLFDPRHGLDQPLAEDVLARMWPALRYAADSRGWLRRGPDAWEHLGDLADYAVSAVAWLMPRGDADAEKGSDAHEQAARRKRFMSSATSGNIARKARALVLAGTHPSAVMAAELDSEPWLLWAGGIAWDLSRSADGLVVAGIDPGTPHVRAAAVTPESGPTPRWDAFTAAVWPDAELRAWALRVMSVCFTGQSDAVLPLLVGEPGRGKTQAIALLMNVLGSYAHAASNKLLSDNARSHDSIITALKGRRLSFIDEAPHDRASSQERLKQLTGGGELTGNQMNQNPITFRPTHTLVLTANHEPNLTDAALRRRVRLIPCEGDPAEIKAARYAIGQAGAAAWRREARGVLAAMIIEAGRYLADESSAANDAAPEAYRYRAEVIAAQQNLEAGWITDATEPADPGDKSHSLYVAFVAWCKDANVSVGQIPTETKWGRTLSQLGYPPTHHRAGNVRGLRIRLTPLSWTVHETPPSGEGLAPSGDGSVTGSPANPSQPPTPTISGRSETTVKGVKGSLTVEQLRAHTHTHDGPGDIGTLHPSHPSQAESAKITASLLAAREDAPAKPAGPVGPPLKPKRTKTDPAERAATKAAAKAAELAARIADAAGPLVQLPAVVTRDGAVRPIHLGQVLQLLNAFGGTADLTVDVEHSGYPIGHADYELRTVQIGTELAAIVYDAADLEQRRQAKNLLGSAARLHAHSAQADIVPLAQAGLIDFEEAWYRMFDTVLPAKLLDPASTGSDPDLKGLSRAVLEGQATSPGADEARAALFKAGKWLEKLKDTTPIERSGWAQTDRRCTTMVRYAGSDVLDGAALARVFYDGQAIPPELIERERTAQRVTARMAYTGLPLDAGQVNKLLPQQRAALADAGERLRAFGVADPGSDQQIGTKALELGAALPRTKTGRASVAKGALDRYKRAEGPVGDFVRARLDYQKAETALGLFLEPYSDLITRGDGRVRSTIYTLSADTGRMSSVRKNLQQVPREGGFRPCITADPGYLLASADLASVEIRVAAALSGDATLRALLEAGIDVHGEIAKQWSGPGYTKADRYDTKRGVFGWLYGASIETIARTLGVSESIAAAIVDTLKDMAPELVRWSYGVREAVKNGQTKFPAYSGRVIHLPGNAPHAAPNYCIQGTARELLVDALVRWESTRWGRATLLPVHDEIVVAVPEAEAEAATAALVDAMQRDLYGVAILAEASEPSFEWKDAA
jgi:P4 family phage/plasmid primase-like protien